MLRESMSEASSAGAPGPSSGRGMSASACGATQGLKTGANVQDVACAEQGRLQGGGRSGKDKVSAENDHHFAFLLLKYASVNRVAALASLSDACRALVQAPSWPPLLSNVAAWLQFDPTRGYVHETRRPPLCDSNEGV